MSCFHPLIAYRSKDQNTNGKRPMVFDHSKSLDGIKIKLPCGKCIGCRLLKSAMWAGRIMNEAQMHMDSLMATLTYSDDHLPWGGCIQYSDVQKFYKRLRRKGYKVRHFTGAEYGDETGRPHYHAIIFGYWPEDSELWADNNGQQHFISKELTEIWGLGHVQFTEVTFDSAAYVARYCIKKVGGELADDHYMRVDTETGEAYWLPPEMARMSLGRTCKKCREAGGRQPGCTSCTGGIGYNWYQQYKGDVFPFDEYMPKAGMRSKTPKYYETLLERTDPEIYEEIRKKRREFARKNAADNTPERLRSKEIVAQAKLNQKRKTL